MAIKTTNQYGSVCVADNVIATIAGLAAMQCAGVVGMATQGAAEGLAELLKIDSLTKGIKVNTENKDITVDINIIVEYGVSLAAVAENVIATVSYSIRSMTGLEVAAVNVNIKGIRV